MQEISSEEIQQVRGGNTVIITAQTVTFAFGLGVWCLGARLDYDSLKNVGLITSVAVGLTWYVKLLDCFYKNI